MTATTHESARAGGFASVFGRPPETSATAPGRVNLIGEHTDYNDGFVLPIAIPQATAVEIARRRDNIVRVYSAAFERTEEYSIGHESRQGSWADYAAGVTYVLRRAGFALAGFEAWVDSTVPLGSGLSSSAAFEVALLRALRQAFELPLSDVALAELAQHAENDLVGAPVGMMDPMASCLADTRTAILLDARDRSYRRVPLPEALDIAVIDSGIKHANVGGGYRKRREECERAAQLLGVRTLREIDAHDVERLRALPSPLDRRARHVVTENARVVRAARALEEGDVVTFGKLLDESHVSMRDDFEISVPEIDRLVAAAQRDPSVCGARLTGGGFGGSIVVACRRDEAGVAGQRIVAAYRSETASTKQKARLLVPSPAD